MAFHSGSDTSYGADVDDAPGKRCARKWRRAHSPRRRQPRRGRWTLYRRLFAETLEQRRLLAVVTLQDFDGVVAPSLPAGWSTATLSGSSNDWVNSTASPYSAPNHAFALDIALTSDSVLVSPVFQAPPDAQVRFRNAYDLEGGGATFYDGGVLEIAINGGAFEDITADGSFVAGGYAGVIESSFANPLAGRQAWSGNSGGYIETIADLPPASAGQDVQLRWRLGTDSSTLDTGWSIDTIRIYGAADWGDAPSPYPTLEADQGAAHFALGPMLGNSRDVESDGQPEDGDGDDENGVRLGVIQVGAQDQSVRVNVQGGTGKLDAWIDFNGDGSWGGPGEQILDSRSVVVGDQVLTFDVPATAIAGVTQARFRLSTAGDLGPGGVAPDGEVEDYPVTIASPASSLGVFAPQSIISSTAAGASSVYSVDVDGDGDLDVLSASADDNKIAWYENDGGQVFTEHAIFTAAARAASVFSADVDGDGDMDVLSASLDDNTIAWYENNGSQSFTRRIISTAAAGAYSVETADVDGDGDMDVLSASLDDNTIAWYENNGSQTFTRRIVSTAADGARSVRSADVDGDGDLDLVSASFRDDKIAWYENNGNQAFTEHVVSNSADGAASVQTADLDGDGDLDMLSASADDYKIAWYENNGSQAFTERIISTTADGAHDVQIADIDGDGDLDVLSASSSTPYISDKIVWYENDGSQGFTERSISTNTIGVFRIHVADMDGDGDLDVLSASINDDKIAWYENTSPDFGDAQSPYPTLLVDDGAFHDAIGPTLGVTRDTEIDGQPATGDGADEDGVTFGTIQAGALGQTVTVNVQGDGLLDAWIDFNADGIWGGPGEQIFDSVSVVSGDNVLAFDVPSTVPAGNTQSRFRLSSAGDLGPRGFASDGEVEDYPVTIISPESSLGVFAPQVIVSTNNDEATSVHAADLDDDGDMDLIGTSFNDGKIAWYENDGNQNFVEHVVTTNAHGAQSVVAADVDGDGDLDVLCASFYDNKVAWYENNGSQSFTERIISSTALGAQAVQSADVDGDGDQDVLSASHWDDKIAWYENDGSQNFTERIISLNADEANGVQTVDVDGDGDLDVLSASRFDNKLAWYENDGSQYFVERIVSTNASGAQDIQSADLDGDGDVDIIGAARFDDKIAWYENDGNENFSERIVSMTADGVFSVQAADVDGDGDWDLLSASSHDDKVAWYENDGGQNFTERIISLAADGAAEVRVADVDGDGDLDVVSASYRDNTIAWYENTNPDFGDAPLPYPTLLADNAAFHDAVGPTLGIGRDVEPNGLPDAVAAGDDATGMDDEDGVTFGSIVAGSASGTVQIDLRNALNAKVDAWIDFDGNNRWESSDQILSNALVSSGRQTLSFAVPSTGVVGPVYARVRVSSAGNLQPTGFASDGEVEDYLVTVSDDIVVDLSDGSANNILVRKNGGHVEVIDQSGPTVLSSTPLSSTYSLSIIGSDIIADAVHVDYGLHGAVGGFFTLPGGIDVVGGSGAGDSLTVSGSGETQAIYSTAVVPVGQTQLTVTEAGLSDTIRYSDYESMTFDRLLTFSADSTLNVGANSLTIESTGPVDLGSLTIVNGGILSAGLLALGSGEMILGNGTISARFAGGNGSLVATTGDLLIGDVAAVDGFNTQGELQVAVHTVTLLDANQAVLGSLTTLGDAMNPGTLSAAAGLLLDRGHNIAGYGTLDTPNDMEFLTSIMGSINGTSPTQPITLPGYIGGNGSLNNVNLTGTYSPGLSPAVSIHGSVSYATDVDLIMEIAGRTPGREGYDQLIHNGSVALGGDLKVELLGGFTPSPGDSFVLMTAVAGITGGFSSFDLPSPPLGSDWDLSVGNDEVRLTLVDLAEVGAVILSDGNDATQRSSITRIDVQFDRDVDIDAGAFVLTRRGAGGGDVSTAFTSGSNPQGNTIATLTFSGALTRGIQSALIDGNYQLLVDPTKVHSAGTAIPLDGNSDGLQGGSYLVGTKASDAFFALYGDTDGDRDVDGQDYGRLGLTFLKQTSLPGFNSALDSDGDGDVDGQDYGRFGQRFLKTLKF